MYVGLLYIGILCIGLLYTGAMASWGYRLVGYCVVSRDYDIYDEMKAFTHYGVVFDLGIGSSEIGDGRYEPRVGVLRSKPLCKLRLQYRPASVKAREKHERKGEIPRSRTTPRSGLEPVPGSGIETCWRDAFGNGKLP